MGKIKTFFKKISDYFFDNKNKFEIIFIMCIIYILVYEIEALRNFIYGIFKGLDIFLKRYDGINCIITLINNIITLLNINKECIKNTYFLGGQLCILYLTVYIVGNAFYFLYKKYYKKYGKVKKEKQINDNTDIFERELFKYLNDKDSKNCFLITGEWGSGKTYCVKEFFNNYKKHFRLLNTKLYNISCFGITTRESIIKEVNGVILAKNDNGYNSFLTIIKHFPIVGEFLADLLKVNYSIDNINHNSIFIFDDFERISYLLEQDLYKLKYRFNPELDIELRNNFETTYNNINKINKENSEMLVNSYLQKYNAVVGLVNDIVENKGCKAIVICNDEKLGYKYFNQIFDEKLNCKRYYKKFSPNCLKSLIENIKDNQIMETDRKNIINNFFDEEYNIINEFWKHSFNKNLRLFDNFLREFFQRISQLDNNYLANKVFIKSMFYTYLIKKYLVNKNNYKYIKNIPTGGNVFFWFSFYKIDININRKSFVNKLCWIQIKEDFLIIDNEMAKEIINCIKSYQYYDIEDKLFSHNKIDSINSKDFILQHILFSLWNNNEDINNISSETVCKLNIENYNIKKDNVSCLDQILNSLECELKNINIQKRNSLYQLFYKKLKVKELNVENICEPFKSEYNHFVKRIENNKKEGEL